MPVAPRPRSQIRAADWLSALVNRDELEHFAPIPSNTGRASDDHRDIAACHARSVEVRGHGFAGR